MKERPILFSAPMVRALLDGSKTQTRRVCKRQPYSNGFHFDGHEILCHNDYLPPSAMLMDYRDGGETYTASNMEGWDFCCPYGQPGDHLWVRETWADLEQLSDGNYQRQAIYRADGIELYGDEDEPVDVTAPDMRWRPSIHMPRWASRILLEIVSVRAERLQDISDDDARAEGCTGYETNPFDEPVNPAAEFGELWESINGAGSWDANPWVWVVEFRRVAP